MSKRIQFNLLPDVKLELDRAKRIKHLVYQLSFLVITISVVIVAISFFVVNVVQKKTLSNADKDITASNQKLNNIPDLAQIMTIQSQLQALPGLHQSKHITSRLLQYLPEVTPVKVNIGRVTLDDSAGTLEITGTADTIESINQYVDTLKFTAYTTQGSSTKNPAFPTVVLSSVGRNNLDATYTIDVTYDPALFDGTQKITLVIPQDYTTTRSVVDAPGAPSLFNGKTKDNTTSTTGTTTTSGQTGGQ